MRLWGGESDTGCCSVADVDDARRVAQQLGIDHLVFNFTDDFDAARRRSRTSHAHAAGSTPNPCIECNRHVKFARLAERADLLGFDAVATGHHARVGATATAAGRSSAAPTGPRTRATSCTCSTRPSSARTLFPVGEFADKAEVRGAGRRARPAHGGQARQPGRVLHHVHRRPRDFLGRRTRPPPGARSSTPPAPRSARSPAVELVTVGQRRASACPAADRSASSLDVDRATATVVVGDEADLLDADAWPSTTSTWVDGAVDRRRARAVQRPRRSPPGDARVGRRRRRRVRWHEPQRRVAPGQSVVFYDPTDRSCSAAASRSAACSRVSPAATLRRCADGHRLARVS